MGVSRSGDQLAAKLTKYGASIAGANRDAVSAAALRYKERAIANAERDAGPDRRLSQWKNRFGLKRGASPRLNASYRLYGNANAKAVLRPTPYGIWALLDGGSKPHRIVPFRYVRGLRSNPNKNAGARRALAFPGAGRGGSGYAMSADHPGTPGKRTFRQVPQQAQPLALRAFQKSHHAALFEVFK